MTTQPVPRIVLVGGGHSHVQVLRRWVMRPVEAEVVVIVDRPVAVYSGMVPSYLAGEVSRRELEIDVRPLARRAGATVIVAPVERVDTLRRQVVLQGRPPESFDLLSVNIGSTVAHADLPGVGEHGVPSRPISGLLDAFDERLAAASGRQRVVVVGAGAGGVEVAFCVEARLRRMGVDCEVSLLSSGVGSVGGSRAFLARVDGALARRKIARIVGRAARLTSESVVLEDGPEIPSDLTVWVTGAAPHGVLANSGFDTDPRGFAWVDESLRLGEGMFAVGDCAMLRHAPWVPRAGVYAVREGPVLARNLEASIAGRALESYRPQRDFLSMLNLGDGTAIVGKWGMAAEGAWVWRWKDRIDRTFMERFQVLGEDGDPETRFGAWFPPMDMEEPCGGCAAKVGPAALARVVGALPVRSDPSVLRGVKEAADVAELAYGAERVLATVDAFPAFTSDPWLVARLAARNALSDVQVQGGVPRHALAVVTVPEHGSERILEAVMRGAGEVFDEVGCAVVGGHSTVGDTLSVGFTVLGTPGEDPIVSGPVEVGDVVVLLGRIGTGVLWRADMLGLAEGRWIEETVQATDRGVQHRIDVLREVDTHAMTDVTGFGLAGHVAELASAAGVGVRAIVGAPGALPGAAELLQRGLRSTAHPHNRMRMDVALADEVDEAAAALWFDPQTASAWVAVVSPGSMEILQERLGDDVARIGVVCVADGPALVLETQ